MQLLLVSYQREDGEAKVNVRLPEVLEFTQGRIVNVKLVFIIVRVARREINDIVYRRWVIK